MEKAERADRKVAGSPWEQIIRALNDAVGDQLDADGIAAAAMAVLPLFGALPAQNVMLEAELGTERGHGISRYHALAGALDIPVNIEDPVTGYYDAVRYATELRDKAREAAAPRPPS
jgi:hypothetical protein